MTGGDTGTSPTGASGTTADTGQAVVGPTDITFTIMGDAVGQGVGLHALTVGGTLEPIPEASAHAVSDRVTLSVAAPPPEAWFSLSTAAPEEVGAIYVPTLFNDLDEDGSPEPGEVYTGLSLVLVVYLAGEGEVPEALAEIGITRGWSAVLFLGDITVNPSLNGIPISVTERRDTLVLSGAYDGKIAQRIAVRRFDDPLGLTTEKVLFDGPLESAFTVTIDGEPPEDHLFVNEAVPMGTAIEMIGTYVDEDDSGSLTPEDTVGELLCEPVSGRPLLVMWIPQSDDLAFTYLTRGQWGWAAAHLDGVPAFYAADEVGELAVGCPGAE